MKTHCDVLVVGGGHAGCEAALAAARLGCSVSLITLHLDTIGQMSCNPAIGGLAKGQLVREIDALGGAMGRAIDATGIQFRILNASKGPAVQSPRAQADKRGYQLWMQHCLEGAENLHLIMDEAVAVKVNEGRVIGVHSALGIDYLAKAVVLTTGTFLKGLIHTGTATSTGGRHNENSAEHLSGSLRELGLPVGRLKTGTPARIHRDSIDYSLCELQPGDDQPKPFSFTTKALNVEQIPCHTVYSNEDTLAIVTKALPEAPVFTGQIQGVGPRYCPSFEVKVERFPDRSRHLLHLEPEGRNTKEVYINGMSTSLAPEVQEAMIRSIPALRNAQILRYGYAVEYDFVPPRCLRHTLETRVVKGLYHAGQLNGTSGYEEAAAQGLVAGVNAALQVQGRDPFVLDRSQAYIGVLIDDLVTKGTDEPYRLFTSRAEYRLLLRSDNADLRLIPVAGEIGLVSPERVATVTAIHQAVEAVQAHCAKTFHAGASLDKLLRQPERSFEEVATLDPEGVLSAAPPRVAEQVKIQAKYAGYIERQLGDIERYRRAKAQTIPEDFSYQVIDGLRCEAKEKLMAFRPADLEDAGRISGVSPADVAIIAVHLKRHRANGV